MDTFFTPYGLRITQSCPSPVFLLYGKMQTKLDMEQGMIMGYGLELEVLVVMGH